MALISSPNFHRRCTAARPAIPELQSWHTPSGSSGRCRRRIRTKSTKSAVRQAAPHKLDASQIGEEDALQCSSTRRIPALPAPASVTPAFSQPQHGKSAGSGKEEAAHLR